MAVRDSLYAGYFRLERALAPAVRYSQEHYEALLDRYVGSDTRWLDLGCGRRLLAPWRSDAERQLVARCRELVGIDQDLASLRDNTVTPLLCFGAIGQLPFRPSTFSLVTANMVVEHLADPGNEFREIHRVLAPGGLFVFHTPNVEGYPTSVARRLPDGMKRFLALGLEGRSAADVFPTHYRANSSADLRALAAAVGFEIVELRFVSTSAVFAIVPPVAFVELLFLRTLAAEHKAERRSNIIAVFRKA
jgi:SAM-dependent methyltransferase